MQRDIFGHLADGRPVEAFRIGAPGGITATVLSYGARLAALHVPLVDGTRAGPSRAGVSQTGSSRNVVLGHPDLAGYVADTAYLGAVVGRYGNRIAHGRFTLDGQAHQVSVNNGGHALHGGTTGFDRAVWQGEPDGEALVLRHVSPDGDQGFPGTLTATVTYAIVGDTLSIDYVATSDAATVLNLTNHAYWSLSGAADILDHRLTLHAERFTPVDATLIPTGALQPVAGTPFDFRTAQTVGARIAADDEQLRRGEGYDHNFVLADAPRAAPVAAARVEAGGLVLEVATTEPGVQFYSGNFLAEAGWPCRAALCLETQHFPDSPNQPGFPTTVLRPGARLHSRTEYRLTAG